MSGPSTHDDARRWLRFAREDLAAARMIAAQGGPRNACYLAQQCAEKAIKACYIFDAVSFAYIHNLDLLRDDLPGGWQVKAQFPALGSLTDWVARARYPGLGEPTAQDAADAIALAEQVYQTVEADLIARGLTP